MKLIKPTLQYKNTFQEALEEFEAENAKGFWNIKQKAIDNIELYIHNSEKYEKGIDLPENWVPASTYWLMDEEKFLGHVSIRHKLNVPLKKKGGHIGYAIRPSVRRKGYGKKILELALPKARKLDIKNALITCIDTNVSSQKIIESHGGVYQDKNEVDGIPIRRYWIALQANEHQQG